MLPMWSLLRAAGAERARLLVIAIDDREKAINMIQSVRMQFPKLKILARAYDRTHAYELIHAGADYITRETFGSALAMGEEALKLLGHRIDVQNAWLRVLTNMILKICINSRKCGETTTNTVYVFVRTLKTLSRFYRPIWTAEEDLGYTEPGTALREYRSGFDSLFTI